MRGLCESYETAKGANYGFWLWFCVIQGSTLEGDLLTETVPPVNHGSVCGGRGQKYSMSRFCKSTEPYSVTVTAPAPPPWSSTISLSAPPLMSASLLLLICRSLLHLLLLSLLTLTIWVADFSSYYHYWYWLYVWLSLLLLLLILFWSVLLLLI